MNQNLYGEKITQMKMKYYAHSLEGRPAEDWQPLEEHLKNVAEKARLFADAFRAGDWGCLAGLWHDVGKFQRNLRGDIELEPG
ncbi:MAG: hypothetical protein JRJ18_15220 [Deltaproteobacteria bacterium]|nr:hypothetical protein [Deltaproteobacteria bacterium]